MVRHSMKYVPWKNYKGMTADLKRIYQSVKEEEARPNSITTARDGMINTHKLVVLGVRIGVT